MERIVEPEILDALQQDDPLALASRRDLARLNLLMRHASLMARELRRAGRFETLVDLGAGDGTFLLSVARRLTRRGVQGVRAVLLDKSDSVTAQTARGFAAIGWDCETCVGDIFDSLPLLERGAAVTANLFLHHLKAADLARLFALVADKAGSFVACEPRRNRLSLCASRCVGLIGANKVTRHDAVASVRAGFVDRELTGLWPRPALPQEEVWVLREGPGFPFSHCFTAVRRAL